MPGITFTVNSEYAQLTELVPGLFICGVSGLTRQNMIVHRITHIINATHEVPNVKSLGDIQRSKLWLEDTPQTYIYPQLELQSDIINAVITDGGCVLVHCVAGVSRSASICLAYLTKYVCRSLRDAYHLMSEKRPMVRPNIGFWRQLIAYEQATKRNAGSVRLIRDEEQEDKLLPDVYFKETLSEPPKGENDKENGRPSTATEKRARFQRVRLDSHHKPRFEPVLEPVMEILVEANA